MDLTRLSSAVSHELRDLPQQFWILVAGTLFYVLGVNMCMPFAALYLTGPLEIPVATTGLLIGLMGLVGLPVQFPGGAVADRLGRRPVLVVAIIGSMTFCLGLSFARDLWQVALVLFVDAAFGWPMYLTSTHTMIADLVPIGRRAEALGIIRTGINAGAALGPLLAAALLGGAGHYRTVFVVGAGFCAVFLVLTLTLLKETRPSPHAVPRDRLCSETPVAAPETIAALPGPAEPTREDRSFADHRPPATLGRDDGYGVVLRDTHFLAFCAVIMLALYGLGQIWVTLPVVLAQSKGIDAGDWGLLLTAFNISAATLQYPLVRAARHADPVLVEAMAALVLSGSVAATVFVTGRWSVYLLMITASVGYVLLLPVATGIVSGLAPLPVRGRYLGVWTFVFLSGYSMGPLLGGIVVTALGHRLAYAVVAATGFAAAGMLLTLRPMLRRRAIRLAGEGAA